MKLTFAPKEIIQIDDCRIVHRNLSGRGDKYNREGDSCLFLVGYVGESNYICSI